MDTSKNPSMNFQLERCAQLSKPDIPQATVAVVLLVWLGLSYVPQYYKIISRKSAEGLSALFLLLGSLASVGGVGNIIALPASQVDLGCCKTNSRFACVAGTLGMVQIVVSCAFFWILMFLYVYYTRLAADPSNLKTTDDSDVSITSDDAEATKPTDPEELRKASNNATYLLAGVLVWTLLVLVITALVLKFYPQHAYAWANILGLVQMLLAFVQWFPQIYTTYALGSMGSLSIKSLSIATPSTFVWIGSLYARVGMDGWSAWIVFVVVAVAQVTLLSFAIFYAIRKWRVRKAEAKQQQQEQQQQGGANERSALLQ